MVGVNYILEGKTPVLCDNWIVWGKWYAAADRTVAKTVISPEIEVSTFFLGFDCGWKEEVLLFETMIFGGPGDDYIRDGYREQYETWEEAEEGHKRVVDMVMQMIRDKNVVINYSHDETHSGEKKIITDEEDPNRCIEFEVVEE